MNLKQVLSPSFSNTCTEAGIELDYSWITGLNGAEVEVKPLVHVAASRQTIYD